MNRIISHLLLSAFLVFLCAYPVSGQLRQHLEGNSEFSRRLDAIQFGIRGDYALESALTKIQFRSHFNSRLYLIRGRAENIQDEYRASLDASHWFSTNVGASVLTDAYEYSASDVRQLRFVGGPVFFRPDNGPQIRTLAGLMSDSRNNRTDTGPSFSLTGAWPNLVLGQFRFSPIALVDYAHISPRSYGTFRLASETIYSDDAMRITGGFLLGRSVRDSYQASSFLNRDVTDLVESIRSDTAQVMANITLPVSKHIMANIDVFSMSNTRQFTNRSLSDTVQTDLADTRFLRQDYDILSQLYITQGKFLINPGIRFSGVSSQSSLLNASGMTEDQAVRRAEILQRANYRQRFIEIFSEQLLQMGNHSHLSFRILTGILRYDTPEINKDDRDEQHFAFRLTGKHRFSPYLDAGFTLAGEAYHNVYLFSERSADNNWRRSLRFLPEVQWTPLPQLTIRQAFFIRANYTVYDFRVPGRMIADQSAREYGVRSRVEYEFNPGWFLEADASRSELRIGRLMWDTFTEIPIDTLITYDGELTLAKKVGALKIAAGVRVFSKYDFMPQVTSTILVAPTADNTEPQSVTRLATGAQISRQIGPVVNVMLPIGNSNELYVDGWLQHQRIRTYLYTEYPEEYRSEFLRKEREYARTFYPNLTLRARFRF